MMHPMFKRFVNEGILPNLKKLAANGVMAEGYSSLPAWTPTNWATLITGAHTGTHSASRWFLNIPSPRKTERTLSSFVRNALTAETVFDAAAKASLKSVAFHYPAASPTTSPLAATVDGFGHPAYGTSPFEVTPAWGYTNIPTIKNAYQVTLQPARGWQNPPPSRQPALEFPVDLVTKRPGENQVLIGLVIDSAGKGYDTVVLCAARDGRTEVGRSLVGTWSQWIKRQFVIEGKKQDAVFRFKTIELSPDGARLRLYRSQVMYLDGFTEPPELAQELVQKFGPYLEHASPYPYVWNIADLDTCLEEIDYHCQWTTKAAKYLLEEKGYSLMYTHIHIFDYFNHFFLPQVDPECPGYDAAKAEFGWHAYREAYKTADRIIATLLDGNPQDTAIVVVSDHAAYPQKKATDIYGMLRDKGYLVLKDNVEHFDPNEDFDKVDMARTKVFVTPVRSYEFFINAPEGSKEYEAIQDQVLTMLRTWVDKESGKCPILLALPKRHAALLGYWGDQCGDIIYFMEDGYESGYPSADVQRPDPYVWVPKDFGAHHGPYLPTARTKVSSNAAFFLGWGKGLKNGYERNPEQLGYMHETSVVPIVCHLLNIAPPDQCQGNLPRDFLEGTQPTKGRSPNLPDWEWGTRVEGWGDRVWTQKRDMFERFLAGYGRE